MGFEFSGWSDSLEDFERAAIAQVTGFKRCHLTPPIHLDYISSGFVNLLGYTPEQIHELFNDESVGFVHPDDARYYQNLLRRFSEKEMSATFHYRVICKDGSVKFLNDTMKSIMLNGEMWGFSCVSDATNMHATYSVGIESLMRPNALVSLCFDMSTRNRIAVDGEKSQIPFEEDADFDSVQESLRALVHPQDLEFFSSSMLEWHLRESVSFECRIYTRSPDGRIEYRWVRIKTVCYHSPTGGRPMVLNVEDVNARKLAEINAVESMGRDWLTGLMSVSAFHSLCLRRGFTDGKGAKNAANGKPSYTSLRVEDFSFFADCFEDEALFREPAEDYDFRSLVAISVDKMPISGNDIAFYEYYVALKRAANSIKLASMDGDLTTRVDAGLFFIMPMTKLSRAEYIDRARILLSSMMVPLGNGCKLSARAGIALCPVGETYENAFSYALESLEEALREPEPCVVFRTTENPGTSFVHPVFGAEGFVRHAESDSRETIEDRRFGQGADEPASASAWRSESKQGLSGNEAWGEESGQSLQVQAPSDACDREVDIRTFGYFDVFVDGAAVVFQGQKSKELLALLVDHHGGFVLPEFAISRLWESEPDNKFTRARYRKVALNLRRTLEEHGISDIMEERNGSRRIVPELVNCDLFNYQMGKRTGRSEFRGVYLPDYSWGELTLAQLAHESLK